MPPVFLCDAMLGGLARWLRAAGYRAEFDVHMEDGELVRRGKEEGKIIVTSDADILARYAVREELVRTIYIPHGMSPIEQLSRVMQDMGLELRAPRCMECGGVLKGVDGETVTDRVPDRVRRRFEDFFRCAGCNKVYWRGSHWEDIQQKLHWAAGHREEGGSAGRFCGTGPD